MSASNPFQSSRRSQSAACVLLVRPAAFGYNPDTATTNQFQRPADADAQVRPLKQRALAEFDALCAALEAAGVRTVVGEDSPEPAKPDAVFPNNWVSWHHDGTVVLYPMQPASRRPERRPELIAAVEQQAGFRRRRCIDLSDRELEGRYLEGTGSLVLDHCHGIAYACRSARTDEGLLAEWGGLLHYTPCIFDARAADGSVPYHTNVMLAIGTHWAIVCAAAIVPADRERVLESLAASGRTLITISREAMQQFAANVLEVRAGSATSGRGASDLSCHRHVLAMSASAAAALQGEPGAWSTLRGCVDEVVAVDIGGIEQAGGGSVRCMLAEVFSA
ncbi:MAG TPA: arginine deiminase-related protein [Steroidobacteraceae bacterium]|nr:arginine deiminase-related protein [Steroidobacteraceae bacterium]